jgi:hypothetical protein
MEMRKWLRLLCCWFWRTAKAMGLVYQYLRRIFLEANGFSMFEYHILYVL